MTPMPRFGSRFGVKPTACRLSGSSTWTVFNLEVARSADFFVGRAGALAHDNSLVEPVAAPFDAPAVSSAASEPNAR